MHSLSVRKSRDSSKEKPGMRLKYGSHLPSSMRWPTDTIAIRAIPIHRHKPEPRVFAKDLTARMRALVDKILADPTSSMPCRCACSQLARGLMLYTDDGPSMVVSFKNTIRMWKAQKHISINASAYEGMQMKLLTLNKVPHRCGLCRHYESQWPIPHKPC